MSKFKLVLDDPFIFDWVPTILVFGGIALAWIGEDQFGLVMYFGFILYGVLGLVHLIRKRPEKRTVL